MEHPAHDPAFTGAVAMLPVTDVRRTITFYEQLGFTVGSSHTPPGAAAPVWAWLHNGRAHLMFNHAGHALEATHDSVSLWLYTSDVAAAHATLTARGLDTGEVSYPPYNPAGEFHVHDPDGYAVFIAQAE